MYRYLLRLLTPRRRQRFGDEMSAVFAEQHRRTGSAGRVRLWLKEVIGMAKFALRDRWTRPTLSASAISHVGSGGRMRAQLRWAWRGVRSRGWRAVFIVLLLGIAVTANTVVFSAADAFVFARAPYPHASRLVVIERNHAAAGVMDYLRPAAIREWRTHTDLFAAVHAHEGGRAVFLTSNGTTEAIRTHRVTPGLIDALGVVPVAGRPLTSDDARGGATRVALISDVLAGRLFGGALEAIGQTLTAGTDTVTIIGVMPAGFRFPSAREAVWMPLDLDTWPERIGVRVIAVMAPDRTADAVAAAVADRGPAVYRAAGLDAKDPQTARLLSDAWGQTRPTVLFALLVGAAACLLLIACANVASLELALAAGRSRTLAVQAALGASRGRLVGAVLLEGALLLGVAAAAALAGVHWTTGAISRALSPGMRDALVNAIDLDMRALAFMLGLITLAWLLTSLPALVRASRPNLMHTLRDDARTMPVTRGAAALRHTLMAGQVALTVLLLVGALLFVRAYAARAGLDKGFDVDGLVSVVVSPAPDAPLRDAPLEAAVLDQIRAFPGVHHVARTYSIPPSTTAGISGNLHIWGRPSPGLVKLASYEVDRAYFETMRIPIVQGRVFGDRTGEIVIDDAMARRYWPDGSAIGARIKVGGTRGFTDRGGAGFAGATEFEVVGVTSRLRADRTQTPAGDDVFIVYGRLLPQSTTLTFVARLSDVRQIQAFTEAVRAAADRCIVRTDTLAARYAHLDVDARLAATVTSGFGAIALFVAMAGIYAVMTFLVAGRTREIGIRLALGATPARLRRLVLGSSLTFVAAGAAIGLAGAAAASRWIERQLDGQPAVDPVTYVCVTALVVGTALAATWPPARAAMRVDPAITLKSE